VRDYAAGDLAQERFEGKVAANQKLSENFYVRHDGTRAYYFTIEDLVALFAEEGMEMREVFIHQRTITNRADSLDMNRRWIQANFASAKICPMTFAPPERLKPTTPWGK
jgi:methyltransferase-like protein 6